MRVAAVILALLALLAAADPAAVRSVADRVYDSLAAERRAAGVSPWQRRSELDAAALGAAEHLARSGARSLDRPVDGWLDEAGATGYARAMPLVQSLEGWARPAEQAVEQWRRYRPAWEGLMDPGFDGIGLAEAWAGRRLVLVAVLVEDLEPPEDLTRLERRAVESVNRIRERRGLAALAVSQDLAGVARRHSRDMAERGYFDHVSPEGADVATRVRAAGILFLEVAENISRTEGADDPVEAAVDGWMRSPGHRAHILDADFTDSGVGAARAPNGAVVLTQVFLRALSGRPRTGVHGEPAKEAPR